MSEFTEKRAAFKIRIKQLAMQQRDKKLTFQEAKAETLPMKRSEILNPMRKSICSAKQELRYFLLAYAMVRGKSYRSVEPKARKRCLPFEIWHVLSKMGMSDLPHKLHIEAWLAGKPVETQLGGAPKLRNMVAVVSGEA